MQQQSFNSRYILGISFISALGGYLFGFDFAVISGALPFLQKQFELNEYWEGFATGSLAIGAIAGCLIAAAVSDKYGRKKGLMIAASIFMVSSIAMALSGDRNFFIFSRAIAGVSVGMASMLSPMYISEISPAHLRGRMVAINQLTIVIGILITNLVNYTLRNQGADAWRWMFGLGAIPSALFLLGALQLPESPRWLISAGHTQKASSILARIGGADFAANTVAQISQSLTGNHKLNYRALLQRAILPAVLVGIGLAVFQQLCGINVVFNYAPRIFDSIGASQDDQLLQTVFIGAINLVFTLLAMLLVDKLGRKPLMLIGAGGLAVLYGIVVSLLAAGSANVSWFLLMAIGTYAMTLAPVTWVLIAEIFPNKVRGAATSIAVISLWLAYFILVFTFPILFNNLKDSTFYIYAGICVIGFFFVWFKIRETKGKTLEELEGVISPH
ncbi:sugar porter family MFS transporter [Pseudobacter ginsenosidimutans]|uniref:Sugar porter (SP) family MFS transporter n=1 Tax=Pseudobacter ginsenosidimutans TaxID=661488 RepID=A0A4Q7MMH2_9BACT|nr:sugar porter family MFS transporter [Pseudobacter ginsenosidimutans]QEC40179.1 sugar porter family MFS transporter [Pseudobacter ginsenosidimutans]RZS69227.1 sugar porter (SP) family MFS transporter [Pseudobacter ginsenosidimutans]